MTGSSGAAPAGLAADSFPSARQMMGWIRTIVAQGVRRPGYPADAWTERWAHAELTALGLTDVRLEEVSVPYWEPGPATLSAWQAGTNGSRLTLSGFPLPHTCPTTGLLADLALLTDDTSAAAPGRIAVSELTLGVLAQRALRPLATAYHDPEGEFDTLSQTLPFGPLVTSVMQPALDAGAAGFVGLLTGVPWETSGYYVPYDAVPRPIPGLWLSGSDGRRLLDLLATGPTRGLLSVAATRRPTVTHNVVGMLPGRSSEWVIIASHHDGPWASAVEDASGVALVLAQAAYWSRQPHDARPHNLLFLLTSGHMAHAAGTRAFIDAHPDLLPRVVLEIHLEHAARRCEVADGLLVPTEDPEVRWWFTSRNPALQASVLGGIRAEDLRRSLVLPPDVFFPTPPTDGAFFHAAGVPLVHFLTAPMYLFDPGDTIDKVHEPSLVPLCRAVARIIADLHGVTADHMRRGITGD